MPGLIKISLQNFRNYEKRTFEFGLKTLIVGENGREIKHYGSGLFVGYRKNFRADYESEMVSYDKDFLG